MSFELEGGDEAKSSNTWVGITSENIRSDIVLENTHTSRLFQEGRNLGPQPLSLILYPSSLANLLQENWTNITNEEPLSNPKTWLIPPAYLKYLNGEMDEEEYTKEIVSTNPGGNAPISVLPIRKIIIDALLDYIDNIDI